MKNKQHNYAGVELGDSDASGWSTGSRADSIRSLTVWVEGNGVFRRKTYSKNEGAGNGSGCGNAGGFGVGIGYGDGEGSDGGKGIG